MKFGEGNEELLRLKENHNIPYWAIANKLGKSEGTVIRWFRTRLSEEKKEKVIEAIQDIASKG